MSQSPPLRYELKFVAAPTEPRHIVQWLRLHQLAFREAYEPRLVNSVYFDSPDYGDYAETVAGLNRRVKVRLRWYGAETTSTPAQLEVKCKRNGLSWKLTYPLAEPLAFDAPWRRIAATLRRELPSGALPWLLERPQPIIMYRYMRYYYATADGSIRATVDTDQQVYDQRYCSRPNLVRRTPVHPASILEVKLPPELAREVGTALSGLRLRVSRNSKYCRGLEAVSA
jgi:VTC domain